MYTPLIITELQIERKIWVYLPDDYAFSGRQYPVLYMQEGQNLFDASFSFTGEWNIDEYLDTVPNPLIVIGIDNRGDNHVSGFDPDDPAGYGITNGKNYLDMLVQLLKPYVDDHFRTIPDKSHTFIAGSSLGGLIAFYAGLYYPEIFGSIGVLSPSFWMVPDIGSDIRKHAAEKQHDQRYFFYGGMRESEDLISRIEVAASLMKSECRSQVSLVTEEKGRHTESSWRKIFPIFYQWLMEPLNSSLS